MRKSIGQELYLYRSNMGILAAVSTVSWLAGILGMMVFQQLTKSGEALFPIGTVMLILIWLFPWGKQGNTIFRRRSA